MRLHRRTICEKSANLIRLLIEWDINGKRTIAFMRIIARTLRAKCINRRVLWTHYLMTQIRDNMARFYSQCELHHIMDGKMFYTQPITNTRGKVHEIICTFFKSTRETNWGQPLTARSCENTFSKQSISPALDAISQDAHLAAGSIQETFSYSPVQSVCCACISPQRKTT